MEPLNSIEKFYSPAPEIEVVAGGQASPAPELDFPVNAEANWPQTRVGPEAMLLRCEANLRFRNDVTKWEKQRLAARCNVEFVIS